MNGEDISKVLNSDGPIVKCVLLKCGTAEADDDDKNEVKKASIDTKEEEEKEEKSDDADQNDTKNNTARKPVLLQHLIEEVEVDTTPKKQAVAQLLGGPMTFLGQYEEEGIMLMVRRPTDEDEEDEENEQQPKEELPPLNHHKLQPPFDEVDVRGDILIMKVAPTEEALDNEDETKDDDMKESGETKVAAAAMDAPPSNDDFFLNYTKEEYIAFASRTDVVAPEVAQDEEVSEGEEEEGVEESGSEDDGDDGEFEIGEDDEFDSDEEDDSPVAMMNLIMGQVLRRFQDEHGRGPDTRELLDLRSALAEKLGVEVPEADELEADWDQKAVKKKRTIIEPPSEEILKSPVKSILTRKRTVDDDENSNLNKSEDDTDEPEAKRVKWNQKELTEETILVDDSAIVTPGEENPASI